MGDLAFTVDFRDLDEGLQDVARGLEAFPPGDNPLLEWRALYALRTARAQRPTVGQSGNVRENQWEPLKPQYTRKTDNVTVPVWGGVPRLRAGTVTRASGSSIRTKAAGGGDGFGVVHRGQRFTEGPVLGRLKRDGNRYKSSDQQLGEARPGDLLGDWMQSEPLLSDSGKTITVVTNVPYAGKVHDKRPFAYGGDIDKEETESMKDVLVRYFQKLLDKMG